jgi:hypothetical protein
MKLVGFTGWGGTRFLLNADMVTAIHETKGGMVEIYQAHDPESWGVAGTLDEVAAKLRGDDA